MSTTIHINKTTGEVYIETDNMHEEYTIAIFDELGTSYNKPDDVILREPLEHLLDTKFEEVS